MTKNANAAETAAPQSAKQQDDPMLELMLAPWTMAEAAHDLNVEWCRRLANYCFCSGFPPHPHEVGGQLEIPDPIAARKDQDLFA